MTTQHLDIHTDKEGLPRTMILRVLWVSVCLTVILCIVAYLYILAVQAGFGPVSRLGLATPHRIAGVRQEPFRTAFPIPNETARQTAQLQRFEWIDRQQGIITIPIEAAMHLWLERKTNFEP